MNAQSKSHVTEFDAIVIGSGITGGWAAKELCEAGLKVLMLERGRNVEHIKDYTTEHKAPWEMPFRGEGSQQENQRDYALQSTHWLFNEYSQQYFVKDVDHPYISDPEHPFKWYRGYQVGGRSLIWGRQSLRWSDLDFEANARDNHGIDWPIRYRDIAPWYDYVEDFIGVSGEALGLPQLPDGKFLPPMPFNCAEQFFKEKVEATYTDRVIAMGRAAVNTVPHRGRGACHYCGPCERGCSVGAYFSTQSSTLPAARATDNLTLKADQIVERINYDNDSERASSVSVIDANTHVRRDYTARVIFVCASTVASNHILLNSRSEAFPTGLGNSSGTLGHYLMDHAFAVAVTARFPGMSDRYFYGNRPNTIYVPRFQNLADSEQTEGFIRGYAYQGRAWRPGWRRGYSLPGFGKDFKQELRRPGPWVLVLVTEGECLPRYNNAIELDEKLTDKWNIPQIRIRFDWGENELKLAEDGRQQAVAMAETAGCEILSSSNQLMPGGAGIHEMGGIRMGRNPDESVLNGYNQMHEIPNVFVTDGSCMTSSGWTNPSLNYMALTARACAYAVEQLKMGVI